MTSKVSDKFRVRFMSTQMPWPGISISIRFVLATAILVFSGCEHETIRIGKVAGSSMAPHFLGEHYRVVCPDCRLAFACDVEQADDRLELICPNCSAHVAKSLAVRQPADEVEICLNNTTPKRWDVIAFQVPKLVAETGSQKETSAQAAGIKRVIGLPGELIEIRGGNVFANGQLVRKSRAEQVSIRVLVYDSKFRPRRDSLLVNPGDSHEKGPNWIGFGRERNYSHNESVETEKEAVPIEDFYGFNQSLNRELNPMDEVFVSIRSSSQNGNLYWKYDHRGDVYVFRLDLQSNELSITSDNSNFQSVQQKIERWSGGNGDVLIEFSSLDLQLVVWIESNEVFRSFLAELREPASGSVLDFGLAGEATIDRIQIWRDLHYLPAHEDSTRAFVNENGYILLGDNVPISVDSRHWPTRRLPASSVIGVLKSEGQPDSRR